jgi:hypothetical protein
MTTQMNAVPPSERCTLEIRDGVIANPLPGGVSPWAAKLKVGKPTKGGGWVDRAFLMLKTGKNSGYLIDGLSVGDAVQFARDRGQLDHERLSGVVRVRNEQCIEIEVARNAKDALWRSDVGRSAFKRDGLFAALQSQAAQLEEAMRRHVAVIKQLGKEIELLQNEIDRVEDEIADKQVALEDIGARREFLKWVFSEGDDYWGDSSSSTDEDEEPEQPDAE